MNETTDVNLPESFWQTQRGLLLVGEEGSLRFTRVGREKYAPLLAKYGFSISTVTTLDRFREVMAVVNQGELDANTHELRELLAHPDTNEEERAAIRRVLGL